MNFDDQMHRREFGYRRNFAFFFNTFTSSILAFFLELINIIVLNNLIVSSCYNVPDI